MKKRDFLKAGAGAAAALAALPVEAQQSGPTYTWKMATGAGRAARSWTSAPRGSPSAWHSFRAGASRSRRFRAAHSAMRCACPRR
ncbi:MAG TPA: hypothetical protein VFZ94_05890 [Burkholderiales bacterium]